MSIVTVTVVYLGRAREEAGAKEDHFELQSPANVDKAFSEAINIHPGLSKMRELIRPLLNGQWANGKDELKNGDRLALMPPVGGG